MTADVVFDLRLTADALAKYPDHADHADAPLLMLYQGGRGDDHLFAQVAPVLALTSDAQAPVDMLLAGGDGDDKVELRFDVLTAEERALANQPGGWSDKGVRIEAGSGNDQVQVSNFGAVHIDLGAGDDVLHVGDEGGAVRTVASHHHINPGAGDDLVVLGQPSVLGHEIVVLDAGFGHDRVENFGPNNQFDLTGLGVFVSGQAMSQVVTGEQNPGDLGVVGARSITIHIGRNVVPAAEATVASFFADTEQAQVQRSVYISVDANNVGTFYTISDAAGSSTVTASLIGRVDLGQTPWQTLTEVNFV
jgi:hypothetical protein